jgi:glycosyltransferase involved in cell wall biosynthesis
MKTLLVVSDLAEPASIGRGGLSMYVLQWLHGLERLGHRVVFLEFLKKNPVEFREFAVRYFRDTVTKWWHPERSALMLASSGTSLFGLEADEVARAARVASAVITIAAPYRRDPYPFLEDVRPRILVDQDPGYTHIWADGGDPRDIFGEHDYYFTVGSNIGTAKCSVQTLNIRWQPTWNPVVLDWWSASKAITRDRFTTIADWRSYGYLEFAGQTLGPKAEEFRRFIDLPKSADESLEIALEIDPQDEDLAYLRDHGWRIESPQVVTSPDCYRDYLESSCGEFSCVKGGYAGTCCGWFSDRSACYLAAGRPVVLQATGFEDLLPIGKGLFAVRTVAEAAEAMKAIRRDYPHHSAAARAIAHEHFDSDRVVRRLLAAVGIGGA